MDCGTAAGCAEQLAVSGRGRSRSVHFLSATGVTLSVSEVCSLRARYRPSLDLELGAVWAEYSDV